MKLRYTWNTHLNLLETTYYTIQWYTYLWDSTLHLRNVFRIILLAALLNNSKTADTLLNVTRTEVLAATLNISGWSSLKNNWNGSFFWVTKSLGSSSCSFQTWWIEKRYPHFLLTVRFTCLHSFTWCSVSSLFWCFCWSSVILIVEMVC